MMKCPFCHFENEEGALFCEQCKSDLAGVEPVMAAPVAAAIAEAQVVETIPVAGLALEAPIVEATVAEVVATPALGAETVSPPMAAPLDELAPPPPEAPVAEAVPLAAAPTTPAVPSAPTPSAAAPAGAEAAALPAGAQPRLLVLRGQKRNVEFPIYEGLNFVGRADEKPVDIDLEDQEPPDRVWSSRQHAVISFEENKLVIEDLNSSNGTFVNRARIYPGQKRGLAVNDVIQIGTVQLKVII